MKRLAHISCRNTIVRSSRNSVVGELTQLAGEDVLCESLEFVVTDTRSYIGYDGNGFVSLEAQPLKSIKVNCDNSEQ